ncbi:MAG: hypothetical protein ABL984_10030 [Pyrinomonadaceae bacterium]
MRSILKMALMALLTAGIFYLPGVTTAEVSAQAAQDFTVVNKTGIEIYALYVSPNTSETGATIFSGLIRWRTTMNSTSSLIEKKRRPTGISGSRTKTETTSSGISLT